MVNIHIPFRQAFLLVFVALPFCFCACTKKAQNVAQVKQIQKEKEQGASSHVESSSESASAGKVQVLTASDFRKKIMDYESHPDEWVFAGSRPAIIDFYATWCGP